MKQIKIFDTTLRDGEQSPGCSMNLKEKIEMAKQLERLNVDIIEAGFAASSPGDFLSVKTIAETLKTVSYTHLSAFKGSEIHRGEPMSCLCYDRSLFQRCPGRTDIHTAFKDDAFRELNRDAAVRMDVHLFYADDAVKGVIKIVSCIGPHIFFA